MALIGVFGAGSVGCFVGGRLASRGGDVVFVGRARRAGEIAAHGITLEELGRPAVHVERPRYATDAAVLARADVVLCCVKSGATETAARTLAPILKKDAVVVSLQNGVTNAEVLREGIDQPVLAGIVGFNVLAKGEGVFRQTTTGALVIESGGGEAVEALAAELRAAGFAVVRERRIRELQWAKLLFNLNNAVSALSDRPTRAIVLSAGYRRVLASLIEEALAVLRAGGITPARLGVVPPALLPHVLRLPTPLFRVVARAQLRIDPEARSSMWEDLKQRRPTEVDFLNGAIVRLAERSGTTAPRNERIVALVHAAEREGSPGLTAEALWEKLE